jgi:transposase
MPTTGIGYGDFLAWAQGLGALEVVGIEGVGHYGAGLGRALRAAGVRVTEVGRPNRQRRARHGKTDSVDAAGAAAMVLAAEDLGDPKTADGITEMLRVLRIARVSAVRARAKAFNALKDLIVTAPDELRDELAGRHKLHLIGACAGLATSEIPSTPTEAVSIAVKSLAERCLQLDAETKALDTQIEALTAHACPALRQVYGVGPDTAATLLVALGDNPERIGSDAAFAKHRSIQRQNRAAPTQQRRKPRRQPRPSRHLRCSTPPPPTHARLPRPPHWPRQDKSRNHALHKEIHRPRDLPRRATHAPRNPYSNHCHKIGASAIERLAAYLADDVALLELFVRHV